MDILHSVAELLSEKASEETLMRSLLIVECFLRTDHVAPPTMSQILSPELDQLKKLDKLPSSVQSKARKIELIISKLQTAYQPQG